MPYEKHTWLRGETITAENLNHLEDGIVGEQTTRASQDQFINDRIDQIIAPTGEAPNPSEITDARIGEDGTVYNTLGTAIRTQVGDLKNAFDNYGASNIVPKLYGTYYTSTLTVVYTGNKMTVTGSCTGGGYIHANTYNNASAFPDGLSAGMSLQVNQVCSNSKIHFRVYEYIGDSETMLCDIAGTGLAQIKFSQNATGCIIRQSFENGNTYNGDETTRYIFGSLTKQQIVSRFGDLDTQISNDESELAEIKGVMPYGYNPVEFTPITGLVSKYNGVATPTGYSYAKIAVASGEKYKVGGQYYGGNFPAYLILNGDSVLSFYNPESTGAFENLEVTIPDNATHLVVNGNTSSPASIAKWEMVQVASGRSKDSIVVGVGDEYEYNDINTAVVNNVGSVIVVDYGTYETEIQNLATNKILIGKDVDLCILTGTNKDYDTPPIEIAGGIIKNFTVNMINAESASHKGYCLHSDNAATANNTLLVENCRFTCTGQHAVGIGLRTNEVIIFKDCYFEQLDDATGFVPIYIHNSNGENPAIVKFHNCYFKGYEYCMKLQAWSSGNNVQFEFINCTCLSDTYGVTDECIWTDHVSGDTHDTDHMHDFIGKLNLLPTSHGNNVSVLNA